MKLATAAALISTVAVAVSAGRIEHLGLHKRQAGSSSPAASPSQSTGSPAPSPSDTGSSSAAPASIPGAAATTGAPPVSTGAVTGTGTATGNSTVKVLPTVSFSLMSTNPTAVPLSQIVYNASLPATIPLAATPSAGSLPSGLSGAPPIPNANLLVPSKFPPLDKLPPTDSPEVQGWINEVNKSGVKIPNFTPTMPGGCAANPAAVAEKDRCWWTCGGCSRTTDITTCPDKNTWGLSYDDGPGFYTSNLLNYLDEQKLKSTFFVVGSRVVSMPHTLQDEYVNGHQISVHTWSHPQLTTLTNEQIIAELGWTRKAIKDVLGVTPNTFRPPYGDIDDRVRAIAGAMGLTPIIWTRISATQTLDTNDYNINGGTVSVSQVLQNWEYIIKNSSQLNTGFIVLEHDLFPQSVEVGSGYILPDGIAHQFKIEPIVQCQNMPLANAYVETNDNKTNPPAVQVAPGASGAPTGTAGLGGKSSSASSFGVSGATLLTAVGGALAAFGVLL